MTDQNTVQSGLATLGASGWTVNPHYGKAPIRDMLLSPKYQNVGVFRQCGSAVNAGQTVPSTRTFHNCGTFPQEWDQVQLAIGSADTANTVQGLKAVFAPTANFTDPKTPSGGLAAFQAITWPTTGATLNVAVAPGANLWAWSLSDKMNAAGFASIARDDNPAYNLPAWMLRIELPVGPGSYVYTNQATNAVTFNTDALTRGARLFQIFQPTDGVTTPANFTSVTEGNVSIAYALIFYCRGRIVSVAGFGDSIAGGSFSTGYALPSNFKMAGRLSVPGVFPINAFAGGWAGQTSVLALANAKATALAFHPHVAFYSPWSPNDGTLDATKVATSLRQATDWITYCRANDIVPGLTLPTPDNSETITISNLKIGLRNALLAERSRGVLIADWWGAVAEFPGANVSTGWGFKAGTFGDNIHPNDAGYDLMDYAEAVAMSPLIAANTYL